MNDQRPELLYLFQRFIEDECSAMERIELMKFVSDPSRKQYIDQLIEAQVNNCIPTVNMDTLRSQTILSEILGTQRPVKLKQKPAFRWMAAAIAVLAVNIYLLYTTSKTPAPLMASKEEIKSGM